MGKYKELENKDDISPSDKLSILRSEMIVPITAIHGYATILKKAFTKEGSDLPEDYVEWIDAILNHSKDIKDLLEILTGKIVIK